MVTAEEKTNIKDCKRMCPFELDIGPGTTECAVECNSTLDEYGLKNGQQVL